MLTALEETHRGTLDPRRAQAMAAVTRVVAAIYEQSEIAARVAALEQLARDRGREWKEIP